MGRHKAASFPTVEALLLVRVGGNSAPQVMNRIPGLSRGGPGSLQNGALLLGEQIDLPFDQHPLILGQGGLIQFLEENTLLSADRFEDRTESIHALLDLGDARRQIQALSRSFSGGNDRLGQGIDQLFGSSGEFGDVIASHECV